MRIWIKIWSNKQSIQNQTDQRDGLESNLSHFGFGFAGWQRPNAKRMRIWIKYDTNENSISGCNRIKSNRINKQSIRNQTDDYERVNRSGDEKNASIEAMATTGRRASTTMNNKNSNCEVCCVCVGVRYSATSAQDWFQGIHTKISQRQCCEHHFRSHMYVSLWEFVSKNKDSYDVTTTWILWQIIGFILVQLYPVCIRAR